MSFSVSLCFIQSFVRVSCRVFLMFHLGFRLRVLQGFRLGSIFFRMPFRVSFKVSLGFHLWFL